MIKLESGRDRDIIDILGRRSVRHPDPKFVTRVEGANLLSQWISSLEHLLLQNIL